MKGQENIVPFQIKKGQRLNPNGRPKRTFALAKDIGYCKEDVTACIRLYISLTKAEIEARILEGDVTVLELLIIKGLNKDIKDGTLHNLDKLLNRMIGLPKAETIQTNINTDIEVSDAEKEAVMNKLKEMLKD